MDLHDDTDAFADHDVADWIGSAPNQALIELDREIVRRGGLKAFLTLAWPVIEGGAEFSNNWHVDAICEHLEAVSSGEIKRLAIAVPPRTGKSGMVAVMYPAWDWISRPSRRFLFSSYAHNLSIRDGTRCRRVLQSPWFQERWGDRFKITSDQNTKIKFENNKNGYRLSTSVGGQLTGEGGDIVCVDDANNAVDAESEAVREGTNRWFSESLSTRLNSPKHGAFVLIQQRLHERDLMGFVLKKHGTIEVGGDYTFLCLPMEYDPGHPSIWARDPRKEMGELLWPEHIPKSVVDGLKLSLGPYGSAGQLQQLPSPREGGIFKRSWFPIVNSHPIDLEYARGWDLAATVAKMTRNDPDWTAGIKIGWSRSAKKWYITHIVRTRDEPHKIEELMLLTARNDGPQCRIVIPKDPGQAGVSQAKSLLSMLSGFDVQAEPQSGDKMSRAMPLASQAGGGNVCIVRDAGNIDEFLAEVCGFPTGAHDDMVDAAASAFTRLTGGTTGLMEFYARKADGMDATRRATAEALASTGGTLPGLVTRTEYTEDLGRALMMANRPT